MVSQDEKTLYSISSGQKPGQEFLTAHSIENNFRVISQYIFEATEEDQGFSPSDILRFGNSEFLVVSGNKRLATFQFADGEFKINEVIENLHDSKFFIFIC